jgi:rhamnogalacturonan acetylesterase
LANSDADFVDHGSYVATIYKTLGAAVVDRFYPNHHTHTSPEGSTVVEKAFLKGLMCGGSPLSVCSKNLTASIEGTCIEVVLREAFCASVGGM